MSKRIYAVDDAQTTDAVVLVRATSQAQAVNAVVSARYTARVATQDDIVQAMQAGATVIDAKPEAQG